MSEHTNNIKEHCAYIKDRAQKITEALYRVTDLFPEQEPLKWLLRKEGVDILNHVIVLDSDSPHARVKGLEMASQMIPRILCVLELASSGTLISNLNFEVLRREYSALHDFIKSKKECLLPQPTVLLSEPTKSSASELNSVEKIDNSELNHAHLTDTERHKGHTNYGQHQGHSNGQLNKENFDSYKDKHIEKIILSTKKIDEVKSAEDGVEKPITIDSEAKLNRQKKILSFIKGNDWVRVGDIASIFENSISEKTVQRDLVAMVGSGILRKAGDKRWRRYALM